METKIYVGTYAKYNDGSIAGEWLTLSDYADKDEFLEACAKLHEDEHDPEFMFQAFEGETFGRTSEDHVDADLFEVLRELDTDQAEIYAAYRKNFDGSWWECQDRYQGEFKSDKDFAQEYAESCGDIDRQVSWPHSHIDWEAAAAELMQGYIEENGHYFSAH